MLHPARRYPGPYGPKKKCFLTPVQAVVMKVYSRLLPQIGDYFETRQLLPPSVSRQVKEEPNTTRAAHARNVPLVPPDWPQAACPNPPGRACPNT